MGVLTDLIIADRSEAEAVARSGVPSAKWRGVDAKGHNEITLGALLCVLRGVAYDDAAAGEFSLLAQASEGGPWVFALPSALLVSLEQLDGSQIPRVVSEWLENEELRDAETEGAQTFLRKLKELATEALAQQRPVLMWISL